MINNGASESTADLKGNGGGNNDVEDRNAAAILDDPSIFFPEFPCMSSSSSSSPSTPAAEIQGLGDMDGVMENLSYIDLIDTSQTWDPSSVFETDNPDGQHPEANDGFLQGDNELAVIFYEWLKHNRDHISAEDMKTIKLRRSTIESAYKRLGTNMEGKKQLLKLILEWVERHQLHKRQHENPNPSPNNLAHSPFNPLTPDPNCCFSPAPRAASPQMYFMPMNHHQVVNGIPYQHTGEYSAMDPAQSWPMSPPQYNPYPDNGNMGNHQFQAVYGNPYQMYDPNGERLVRLGAAATKEARKRRMARQRQLHAYHHHNRHSSNNSNRHQVQTSEAGHRMGNGQREDGLQPATGDCGTRQSKKSFGSDRRQQQGLQPEKNFKFLLQKVLKQSDVGNLGRIVLPKKEAERNLPELETRDGITIAMEDIGTSRVWNIRYRFWPNNKSRMYLLENTADFVKANGLQQGDFIVLYMDTKCEKYLIRGVKVPQPGRKLEAKNLTWRNTSNESVAGNTSSSHVPSYILNKPLDEKAGEQ